MTDELGVHLLDRPSLLPACWRASTYYYLRHISCRSSPLLFGFFLRFTSTLQFSYSFYFPWVPFFLVGHATWIKYKYIEIERAIALGGLNGKRTEVARGNESSFRSKELLPMDSRVSSSRGTRSRAFTCALITISNAFI